MRCRPDLALAAFAGAALLAGVACSSPPAPPSDPVLAYLATAEHLAPSDREALLAHRPFVGMTVAEAELAFQIEEELVSLNERPVRAVVGDGMGGRYTVVFRGDPPTVHSWTPHPALPSELRDYQDVHPDPPLSR